MVRSNNEGEAKELFHLVNDFRITQKYFEISKAQIERKLDSDGFCEVLGVQEVDDDGTPVAAELRLNINCEAPKPTGWTVALKLHRTRIDGIDWESRYTAADGSVGKGWHRHEWERSKRSAERKKVSVDGFDDPTMTREEFLTRALSELRILLNKQDYGNDAELPFA